jgi:putative ribosome biogenesis GTPase RsgA
MLNYIYEGPLFFFSYLLFSGVLMLNLLIAILVRILHFTYVNYIHIIVQTKRYDQVAERSRQEALKDFTRIVKYYVLKKSVKFSDDIAMTKHRISNNAIVELNDIKV